jgi:post-segregation antitoxin (ccd killing protein)
MLNYMEPVMAAPISVRLDDVTRELLELEARERSIGISTLVREILSDAAREARRRRTREQTKAVAEHIASNPEAEEFFEFWGTPMADLP